MQSKVVQVENMTTLKAAFSATPSLKYSKFKSCQVFSYTVNDSNVPQNELYVLSQMELIWNFEEVRINSFQKSHRYRQGVEN